MEVFADDEEHARAEVDKELDGVMSKQTITRLLLDAVKRGDLTKLGHGKYKCSNAQPYKSKHLSISEKGKRGALNANAQITNH